MLKKKITYTDFNGDQQTEEFYFNLSKAELIEMEYGTNGGFKNMLDNMINVRDSKSLMNTFKEIIMRSYGEKSLDGKRFIKSKELSEAFAQTEAYSELFLELLSDPDAAAAFINGIVPAAIAEEAAKQQKAAQLKLAE